MSLRLIISQHTFSTLVLLGCACWGWTQTATPSAPPKIQRYAEWLIARYDANRDGQLQKDEWQKLQGNPASIDRNSDGLITVQELVQHLLDYSQGLKRPANPTRPRGNPTGPGPEKQSAENAASSPRRSLKFFVPSDRLPEGLPEWFLTRDLDGDAQLTKGEFAPPGMTVDMSEFHRLDANQDGILTAEECVHRPPAAPAKPATSPVSPPAKP